MRALGIDLGSKRIGIAVSDRTGTIASPLTMLQRSGSVRRDHEAIYAAVARGDGTAAAALAEEHIRSAWHLLNPV